MAGGRHPTWHEGGSDFSRNGGHSRRRRSSSRAFFIGVAAVVVFAALLALVGAIAVQSSPGDDADVTVPLPTESRTPNEITRVPPEVTPDPDYARSEEETDPAPDIQITAAVAAPEPTSSTVQDPTTAASSWSAGPTPVPPAPAPPVASEAELLAVQANEAYGVRIVLDGQDWGANEAAQAANIGAVISAIDRLPDMVISAVVAHAQGPLTFVSNNQGRTLDGWQPYGGHPMTYYTNSDQGPAGYHASNQVVLSVGATSMSIGHEVMHGYQFRNVGPDEYALALLQPEMRSFMEAVGWRQTSSDEEVRAAVNQPWSALDSLYVYEGRALTYTTASGATSTITAANPVEAFAITGSMYYARPSWLSLPDWPEYWAWFRSNVG